MPHFSPDHAKQCLLSSIDSLLTDRDRFLLHPDKDFTRTKRISFKNTLLFPMVVSSDNLAAELIDFFHDGKVPSPSAMVQRRNQVDPSAFIELFHRFTDKVPVLRSFYGYQIVACDGSRLNLPYNPADTDTFIQAIQGRKGINQIHLNTLYDPLNDIFLDAELQGIHEMNEQKAFCTLMMRQSVCHKKQIFIADRGFASYNIFAHAIHNHQLFLIRVPELFAKKMCTENVPWLEKEYEDVGLTVHIGHSSKKQVRLHRNYHRIATKSHYDFIERGSEQVDALNLRVVKFPLSGNTYEYIVTNLPAHSFSMRMVKDLYNLRWGVETAYRYLKYAGNMVYIHSLKKKFLIQEIYAKLTLYNFSSFVAVCADNQSKRDKRKHTYVINHTMLLKICIRYLRGVVTDVMSLLFCGMVPVRPGRRFERKLRRQSADTLAYR